MVHRQKTESETCECCGHVTKWGEDAWYCDQCDKEIEWNISNGFTHKVKLWHGNGDCNCGESFPEWQFCSQSCLFEWLKNAVEKEFKEHNLSDDRASVEFTLHPKELLSLINTLSETKMEGGE